MAATADGPAPPPGAAAAGVKKRGLGERLAAKADAVMQHKLHMGRKPRVLVAHYAGMLWDQLKAMLPITLLQVLVLAIFFRKTTPTPLLEAAGLISAVLGLVLFLEGLRVCIMPMAMLVGTQLPQRLKLPFVLFVAFCLGVLVTYAEPAIAAIRPLAALVDPNHAAYLYYIMNQKQELLVLAIGIGVGVAAVIGTLKFLYDVSLKPLIAACLLPTVGLACYMQWGNKHLQPLLGVAWDCGAVTTGPVTVPVLLALGVGVMDAQRKKRAALAVLENAALKKSEGNALEGFGIVTLASLLPVLAVELMAVIIGAMYPHDYVLQQAKEAAAAAATAELATVDKSPVKEVVYAVRAISPLIIALVFLVVVVLRQPLPCAGFSDELLEGEAEEDAAKQRGAKAGADREGSSGRGSKAVDSGGNKDVVADVAAGSDQDVAVTLPVTSPSGAQRLPPPVRTAASQQLHGTTGGAGCGHPSVADAVIITTGDKWGEDYYDLATVSSSALSGTSLGAVSGGSGSSSVASQRVRGCLAGLSKYKDLMIAMLMCQVGMILFNLGLTYGFAALGDMTGLTLPMAFLALPEDSQSPYYSFAGGVTLTMVTIFLLGILATKAEPALNVLGDTVQSLSGGSFSKRMLIWSVCVGVAVGMCAGACKILFRLPLIYFILVKYFIASCLTVVARESVTAVAWDSAGVTTGPVTVPFVLSIGIGFSKAVGAPEGFGMLTVMSVAPIISVLLTDLLKRPMKKAAVELARMSKVGLSKVSRSLATVSTGRGSRDLDFAAQLAADPEAMAAANLSGRQLAKVDPGLARIGEHSVIQTKKP